MPVLGLHQADVFYRVGRGQVHLSVEIDLHLDPRRHFVLRVDDVGRMRATLEAHGLLSEDASKITGWKRCYVFDPIGNKIELDQTE